MFLLRRLHDHPRRFDTSSSISGVPVLRDLTRYFLSLLIKLDLATEGILYCFIVLFLDLKLFQSNKYSKRREKA